MKRRDNNCLFRVLSYPTFRYSDFLNEIIGQVTYYMAVKSERFSVRQNDFEEYLIYFFLDYQAWGYYLELQTFTELYSVNIDAYDMIAF